MTLRTRRVVGVLLVAAGMCVAIYQQQIMPQRPSAPTQSTQTQPTPPSVPENNPSTTTDRATTEPIALKILDTIAVKGRAPKTGYKRTQFGDGWSKIGACDMRNIILHRDLKNVVVSGDCKIASGSLEDPYSGKLIEFTRGEQTSDDVQIDHIVALSNAWQTGAQQLTLNERIALANDPLELVAVDGGANQAKGDGDVATWLPPNKPFRCQYVARQIAVKSKYNLWVTPAESDAMRRVLGDCPNQQLPSATLGVRSN